MEGEYLSESAVHVRVGKVATIIYIRMGGGGDDEKLPPALRKFLPPFLGTSIKFRV